MTNQKPKMGEDEQNTGMEHPPRTDPADSGSRWLLSVDSERDKMTDNPILNFAIIFISLLVLTGIPLTISWVMYAFQKRDLKRLLAKKSCPLCGCEFGIHIDPFHPPYDEWTPRKERTYEYWLFYCRNCQGDIWINRKAEIVGSYPREVIECKRDKPTPQIIRRQE